MSLNPEAEAQHRLSVTQVCYNAMLELRDTIKPQFNAVAQGYETPDHARRVIVEQACKQIDKLAAEHLKKYGS